MTLMQIVFSVVFVALFCPLIVWIIFKAADREIERDGERRRELIKQRQRFDRIMAASERPPKAPGWPSTRVG